MNIEVIKSETGLNESLVQTAEKLYESYMRSSNLQEFLNENGNTRDNQMVYWVLNLNETMTSNSRFTFENGMFIPGISGKTDGRLSLSSIAESCKTDTEFAQTVSEEICESKLFFTPTERDVENLKEAYNQSKQVRL